MRAVVQRVSQASVSVSGVRKASVGAGFLVLLGVGQKDDEKSAEKLAEKIAGLRIFSNQEGKFDSNLLDVRGEALVVSQFTLYADCRKGRRPDFMPAATPDRAEPLYRSFIQKLGSLGVPVQTGEFRAHMDVELVNDGPVTIILDTDDI
ncbi:MAG: D-tyrosyl-tRNA(Tyr) deacylase [Elusimicrobia bacterium]|nr:D-tyrosyl-tRNA(Tyr) deacylase [Elusimicrobiota bacterium]